MHEIVKKLLTHGESRQIISNKLKRMGFLIDQSTIAKWEKTEKPSQKLLKKISDAVKLLEKSSSFEENITDAQELGEFLQTIQCLRISGRKIGEYNLLPIFRALNDSESDSFTLLEFADLLAFSAARGEMFSPESIPQLVKLLRTINYSE